MIHPNKAKAGLPVTAEMTSEWMGMGRGILCSPVNRADIYSAVFDIKLFSEYNLSAFWDPHLTVPIICTRKV